MPNLPKTNAKSSGAIRLTAHASLDELPDITPQLVQFYIQRGKTMRSEYILSCLGSLFRRAKDAADDSAPQQSPNATQTLLNSLTAMRSSLEVLRDTPDISAQERVKFARNALTEEARVERILNDLIGGKTKLA